MSTASHGGLATCAGRAANLRRLLHDANDELSIAALQLELLAEGDGGPATDDAALREALEACRRAAQAVRQAWGLLEDNGDPARKPG